jgi:hypothetical protein
MDLNQKACRARTSSALVHPANRLALQPDSYPLAIGYWRLVKRNFTTKTQRTRSEDELMFCGLSPAFVPSVALW